MRAEVSIAVNFVLSFLYNRLPRRRVNLFGEQLDCNLTAKFQGHWYPEQPLKGTAFRCLKISGEQSDPILLDAARETGLELAELMKHLPQNLTLWIDPGEVSCRVGEKGPVKQLYSSDTPAAEDGVESPEQQLQQQQQQQDPCTAQPLVPDPLWMYQQRQYQQDCYTAATFAQTKFGSTKLRQPPRPHSRQHPHHHMASRQPHQQFQHHLMYWGIQQQQQETQMPWQVGGDFNSIWSCDGLSIAIPRPSATMATPTASSTGNSTESSGHSSPLMLSK